MNLEPRCWVLFFKKKKTTLDSGFCFCGFLIQHTAESGVRINPPFLAIEIQKEKNKNLTTTAHPRLINTYKILSPISIRVTMWLLALSSILASMAPAPPHPCAEEASLTSATAQPRLGGGGGGGLRPRGNCFDWTTCTISTNGRMLKYQPMDTC